MQYAVLMGIRMSLLSGSLAKGQKSKFLPIKNLRIWKAAAAGSESKSEQNHITSSVRRNQHIKYYICILQIPVSYRNNINLKLKWNSQRCQICFFSDRLQENVYKNREWKNECGAPWCMLISFPRKKRYDCMPIVCQQIYLAYAVQ